jgi:hypothetical protein
MHNPKLEFWGVTSTQATNRLVKVRLGGEPLLVSKGRCLKVLNVLVAWYPKSAALIEPAISELYQR